MNAVIHTNNLAFKYGERTILNKLNMDIQKGLFYSIIGPNGSGKTTLLKLIAGLLSSGKKCIYIEGHDIANLGPREMAKQVAVVPQITDIQYEFSVEDIVKMGRTPYTSRFGKESHQDLEAVREAMEETGVYDFRHKKVTQLSGGELQRVILARALAQETEILLLDEPISHLDIGYQYSISELVHRLCQEKGMTVINIVHDLNIAMRYSDRIFMLKDGEIYGSGEPEQVLTKGSIKAVYDVDVELIDHPNLKNRKVIVK